MRIKHISIPIYYGELVLIEIEKLSELNKKFPEEKGVFSDGHGAFTFKDKKGRYVVAFGKNEVSGMLIAHECVHLVNHVFFDRMMKLCPLNDEPQAYLTGWFFEQCEKFLISNQ